MKGSLGVGRVAGVRIAMHWSLLAVVVLIGAGLAQNRLPADAPGFGHVAYALVGAATAVGLMLGVLLHEAGHAVVARRAGLAVEDITLSWMGGVTRLEGDSPSPGWEVAVAGVGPLISAALGGLLVVGRLLAHHAGASPLLTAALGWLAVINVTLAVFNLIPAAPLDGGKVLHGVVWKLTADRWRATRLTSRIGVGFGSLVVAVGFLTFASGRGGFDALVLGLLGYWLVGAARAEGQAMVVHRALDGVTMSELMRPVGAAPGWITVRAFIDQYDSVRPGWVWLLEGWGGGFSSVVTGEAVRAVPPTQWGLLRPTDVGVPITDTAGAAPGDDALGVLSRTGGRQVVLVVDAGHTVGAVLPSDVEALVTNGRGATAGSAAARAGAH